MNGCDLVLLCAAQNHCTPCTFAHTYARLDAAAAEPAERELLIGVLRPLLAVHSHLLDVIPLYRYFSAGVSPVDYDD